MQSDVPYLIDCLKRIDKSIQLQFHQFLVVSSMRQVKLHQAKAFLKQKGINITTDWRSIATTQLEQEVQQCKHFVEGSKESGQKQTNNQFLYQQPLRADQQQGLKAQMTKEKSGEQEECLVEQEQAGESQQQKLMMQIEQQLRPIMRVLVQQRGQSVKRIIEHLALDCSRRREVLMRRLSQVFKYYCRDIYYEGASFEQIDRSTQMLDLRLFLKYFKAFDLYAIDREKFQPTSVVRLFRNEAFNGLWLNFKSFCSLHHILFDLKDIDYSRRQILESQMESLQEMKRELSQQIKQMKKVNQFISQKIIIDNLKLVRIQLLQSSNKTASSNTVAEKSNLLSTELIKEYRYRSVSMLAKGFLYTKQLPINQQQISLGRSKSLKTLLPKNERVPSKASVQLPTIMKTRKDQLSKQNIYKSLRKFTAYELVAQQRKVKDILGISALDDEPFIAAYLKREHAQNKYPPSQKKNGIQTHQYSAVKHFKKCSPSEVQSYMKFS